MRWIIRGLVLIALLAVVAIGSIMLLPSDRIAKIAADQIGAMTGRAVTMQGDTAISFYPILGISTGVVTVANADWSDAGPMFQADSLKVGVEPTALFGGDIRITGLEAVGPQIILERAADGRVNWELGVEGVAPSGQSSTGTPARSNRLALTLDRALIENATLTYRDRGTGETTTMQGMDFDLQWPEYQGRATFDATLRPAGAAVRITGHLDKVGAFIDGAVTDLTADIKTKGGGLNFVGRAAATPQLAGRLTGTLDDTAQFLTSLGLGGADIPRGLGQAISLDSQITLTESMRLALRDMVLQLDDNRLTGAADISLGGKPYLNVQLNADALDLTGLAGDSAASGSSGSGEVVTDGWSKTPIDAGALALADGEFALVAQAIDLGDLKLGKTRILSTLDRSRLVFGLREVRAYDGLITGEFVMNNRSGLSVGGKMKVAEMNMESFLTDALGISRFSGRANGNLSFLGVGQSMHAIMNSLQGDGAISTGRGVISGIDLDKLMRSGNLAGGTTIFDKMGASFTMDAGNLRNNDLTMELPLAKATGTGRIGLGARDIDYLFTPVLLQGETSRGLAIPVRIRGTWANPKIQPDLEKAIDLNLKAEKKELKAKADKEIKRTLEKELGVVVEDGQSIEDAVIKEVEDQVLKEIFKLFD